MSHAAAGHPPRARLPGATRQVHTLTSRTDTARRGSVLADELTLAGGEVLPLRSRARLLRRVPDDPDRLIPSPAKKAAAARVRRAEAAAGAAEASRDASLLELRSPAPGHAALLTNQQISKLNAPVQTAYDELEAAEAAAAATPARVRLGYLAPDMVRLDAETKQITHAIRMAAYNAETILARALDGHYARARDEAYALIREALATSGDIHPGPGQLLIRLDPLTAPRRTQALAALCEQLNQAGSPIPAPISSCATRSSPTPALHDLLPYVQSPGHRKSPALENPSQSA